MRKYLSISLLVVVAMLTFGVFGALAQDGTPEAPEATEPAPEPTEPVAEATESMMDMTGPLLSVDNQIVAHGDNWPGAEDTEATEASESAMLPTLLVDSVTAETAGFVVVSQNVAGTPGTVIGYAPVPEGTSTNVEVTLNENPELVTPILWVTLHEDTGTIGEYEFVEGVDQPVSVDEVQVSVAIQAAPSIVTGALADTSGTITVRSAMIDAPGWLVVHADNDGAPGEVLGQAPLDQGVNLGVTVDVDPDAAGDGVWLMLHYDTGEIGTYEFGQVEGADAPVVLNGSVVVTPISLVEGMAAPGMMATEEADMTATAEADEMTDATACLITAAAGNVNRRSGPGAEYGVTSMLAFGGSSVEADGFATDANGQQWWRLTDGTWVRGDVVTAEGPCDTLAEVEAMAPAATGEAEMMATEEMAS